MPIVSANAITSSWGTGFDSTTMFTCIEQKPHLTTGKKIDVDRIFRYLQLYIFTKLFRPVFLQTKIGPKSAFLGNLVANIAGDLTSLSSLA